MLPLNSSPRFSARTQISPDGLSSGVDRICAFVALWPEKTGVRFFFVAAFDVVFAAAFFGSACATSVVALARTRARYNERIETSKLGRDRGGDQQIRLQIDRTGFDHLDRCSGRWHERREVHAREWDVKQL